MKKTPIVRQFSTGANRDVDTGKLDFEGFYSPQVVECFSAYMHKNRTLRDGSLRDSDNWQKGIPISVYMKSMWRHFFYTWKAYRACLNNEAQEENLCAIMFNAQGMLHELLKEKERKGISRMEQIINEVILGKKLANRKSTNQRLFAKLEKTSPRSTVKSLHTRD